MAGLPRPVTSPKAAEVDLSAPRPWLRRVDPGGYDNAYCLGLTVGRAMSPIPNTKGHFVKSRVGHESNNCGKG